MKKNRILSILLGLAMIVSLAGCGNSNAPTESQGSSVAEQSSTAEGGEASGTAEKGANHPMALLYDGER